MTKSVFELEPIQYLTAALPPTKKTGVSEQPPKRPRACIRQRNRRATDAIDALMVIDGRTYIGRQLATFRDELVAHLGGTPNVVHRTLIERACQLKLRLLGMDDRFNRTGSMSEHDVRTYLAWNNSLVKTLSTIGLTEVPKPQESLADVISAITARKATPQASQAPQSGNGAPPIPGAAPAPLPRSGTAGDVP